ncbi:Sulfotransferase [Candidatus Magnetoovum chiemensis]|nr:Sulfotransferase [Candidatus Magnetoovum chiemensis]
MINLSYTIIKSLANLEFEAETFFKDLHLDYRLKKHYLNSPDKKNTILLASFPKSGNTWLRFIFANIINLKDNNYDIIDFKNLDDMLPSDIFYSDHRKTWTSKSLPCILKSHHRYRSLYGKFNTIFLYRNPLDTMVSYYHYLQKRQGQHKDISKKGMLRNMQTRIVENINYLSNIKKRMHQEQKENKEESKQSFSKFIRSGTLEGWFIHYISWINKSDISISYEELKSNPLLTLQKISNRFSLNIENEIIEKAIELADIKQIKKIEKQHGLSYKLDNFKGTFARNGSLGQWKEYASKEDMDYFIMLTNKYNIDHSQFLD